MKQLSFIDLNYLISEFKILENQRVDNFYYQDEIFYIRVYCRGAGHKYLTNKLSNYIYIGNSKEDSSHPTSFIQYLRKYLKGSFIREITQLEGERIIKISFEQKIEENLVSFNLYLEIFANGNIILTDNSNVIKNALSKKKFKDRTVMVRDVYELPPKKELSLNNLDKDLLKKELKESDLSIVKFLAIKFGMGGKYSEEVCFRLDLDKNENANQVVEDKLKLEKLNDLLSNFFNQKLDPHFISNKKGEIQDFYPFKFNSIENLQKADSFNEIVSKYYNTTQTSKTDVREKQFDLELKKLKSRLEKQTAQKVEIEKSVDELSDVGNKIYENYAFVEELLTQINTASKDKGWDHVIEKINSNPDIKKKIKKLNYKNNEIILNL